MKPIFATTAAIFAASLSLAAAPRLVVSTPSLAPESEIEIILEKPFVEISRLGQTVENHLVETDPPLPADILWKAQNIARLIPREAPAIGATYTFSLAPDQTYLDGSDIETASFATLSSEPLRIQAATPLNRWSSDYSPSTAEWLVAFNDEVDPSQAGPFVTFTSSSGQQVAARLQRPAIGRTGHYGISYLPWSQRFRRANGEDLALQPEDPASNILLATPLSPLPVGEDWKISLLKGLPNASASATLSEDSFYEIGTIHPFRATSLAAIARADEPRHLSIRFNYPLPEELPADFLTRSIEVTPRPDDLSATTDGRSLLLHGNFTGRAKWHLTVRPPLSSHTGLPLSNTLSEELEFQTIQPELALPTQNQAQLASGSRTYPIHTVNLSALQGRVKKLSPLDLVRATQGYRHYTGLGHDWASISPTAPLPYALVSGTTLLDKEITLDNPVDTSRQVTLDWDELLPPGLRHAALFLDITGTPHDDLGARGRNNTQAIVQLTDIGLAWKFNAGEAFLYAFSCTTGKPLENVTLQLFGEDAAILSSVKTDASGLATLSRPAKARHLVASLGSDTYITAFDASLDTVGLWHFPVRYSWNKPLESTRRAFLFTDRSLYRPGETVRLKGIVRTQRGNLIEAASPSPARLLVLDPAEKEIHSTPVTLSENGSFDLTYTLPPSKTGTHTLRLEFPEELEQAEQSDDWYEQEALRTNAIFTLALPVEEFRRNAFEIQQTLADTEPGAASIEASLSARYYQGQPVAAGSVSHFTRITAKNPYPDRFRDFLFGNHRTEDWTYWYHYFGYRWDDDHTASREVSQHHGETILTPEGAAVLPIDIPQADFPTAREITLSSEVTDANNQTLRATTRATVHPASLYVGVSRLDRLVRTGDRVTLKLVAIDPEGNPYPAPVDLTATLTREVNTPVKSRNDDGETVTRNDTTEENLLVSRITLDPSNSAKEGQDFAFSPEQNGKHFLTLRGTDPEGRPFATVTSFNVYGSDEYPWLYEDGLRIKLVSEKKSYKPGDTARILVLSPIEGTALVTLEREKVLHSFLTPLSASNPVIEIPVTDDHAPNAYLSVLVVKGAADSAREHQEPQLRLGYCELTIDSPRDKIALTLSSDTPDAPVSYRPGDTVTLTGTATLADGSPASNAEITLYAEDEGTLAVMGYQTPAPHAFFYNPRNLGLEAGTSFHSFFSEDREHIGFFNKGFFIGGGGDLGDLADLYRKNFDPCATWTPSLLTDATGKFTHTFTVPDTLTRYRVIAVAHHDAARFGHAESSILVNKPLMLEPKAPRFANQSDTFDAQVLVQNASAHTATWEVTLAPINLTSLSNTTQSLTLGPGDSATLAFPLSAHTTGEAVLAWKAVPVSLTNGALTPEIARSLGDAVEIRFPVHFPMPLLRQTEFVKLDPSGTPANLLDHLNPDLLTGDGTLELELSRSPLVEAAGSIEYLLHYPHGCVEQTTSALMPWLAVNSLREIVPAFASVTPEKTLAAIQAGADRILAMQLPDGSFSYWPGQNQTVDWATSYAGLGLLLAKEHGAGVPASAIDLLTNHLIGKLRGTADIQSPFLLESQARALWILSLAGKPQPDYHSILIDRIADLTPAARALLSLALAVEDPASARTVLASTVPFRLQHDGWMRWQADDALQLLAWTTLAPNSKEAANQLDRLLNDRNPYGHWRTTWVNGWSLLALSRYAETEKTSGGTIAVNLSTGGGDRLVTLDPENPAAHLSLELSPDLKLDLTSDHPLYVRLKLAAKPAIAPVQPVATNGLSIDRTYEKINADGSSEILTEPMVGDLIRVSLRLTLPTDDTRYLVVEDLLPSLFETVNSDFQSQSSVNGGRTSEHDWRVSHGELRDDRAVFYLDHIRNRGTYTLSYLARCTLSGKATAPPAKAESMYDPENFALSHSRPFEAAPRTGPDASDRE